MSKIDVLCPLYFSRVQVLVLSQFLCLRLSCSPSMTLPHPSLPHRLFPSAWALSHPGPLATPALLPMTLTWPLGSDDQRKGLGVGSCRMSGERRELCGVGGETRPAASTDPGRPRAGTGCGSLIPHTCSAVGQTLLPLSLGVERGWPGDGPGFLGRFGEVGMGGKGS